MLNIYFLGFINEDIKTLIRYAKNLNIEIMPEIDLPAHSWTLLQVIPELRDNKSNIISVNNGVPKYESIDIDDSEDWEIAESLMLGKNNILK